MELNKKLSALIEGYNQGRFSLHDITGIAYGYGKDEIDADTQQKIQALTDALVAHKEVIKDMKNQQEKLVEALKLTRKLNLHQYEACTTGYIVYQEIEAVIKSVHP